MHDQFAKQYPVYAFDTACFYTNKETELDKKLQALRSELYQKEQEGTITKEEKSRLNQEIADVKGELKAEIDHNVDLVRQVRPEALAVNNIVQVFESTLVRMLHMTAGELNPAMIIVRVYYFGVAESIIKHGFDMDGDHYVFFSASAGQIRTKKFVAIRERDLQSCMNALTCGLSVEAINAQGGVNINKYLAYLALCNSATEEWKRFNINRCIVIDDFETLVNGLVDYIDEKDYSIHRQRMDVPITHTDGCGMILPSLSSKNFMVRAPWIKGLLSPFPFDRFIREAAARNPGRDPAVIKDIYGKEHHILKERIQVIFTKSQFKMWKYYSSFEEYQQNFKKYGCMAGKCNIEPAVIGKATINYQMLQTLVGMTDKELGAICQKTNSVLSSIATDRKTMLKVLGVTPSNYHMNYLQKSLQIYPELLRDDHCRNVLREMKRSIENDARAGKLMIDGKYLFLIPDLYAACQYWFEGIETPDGLLAGDEVYTRQYAKTEQLDVLRSPHLSKEHFVASNVAPHNTEITKWFNTNGIYTSSHSLVSKVLQFDNDGDKALVVADRTIVPVAERECKDTVPLYYPMAKASAVPITPSALQTGMVTAWVNGNIGVVSNQITKIWNSPCPDEEAVKILCMENNFVIDQLVAQRGNTLVNRW